MMPYFPPNSLIVEDYCDLRHRAITIYRISCLKYFPRTHKICFHAVCIQCQEEYGDKGCKIMMTIPEWKKYIDSFEWESITLNDN
jgi:hypothetical protein